MRTSAATFALACLAAGPALAVDWAAVPGSPVTLFYPGQSSYEWVLTPGDHGGAAKFREGKNCRECHKGEEQTMGSTLVSGKKNEPTPIAGKPGFLPVTVKVAHDDKMLYVHLEFAEGSQPDAKQDPNFATKVTMILNDGGVPEANRAGCWVACHDDAARMPSAADADRPKYLLKTRAKVTRTGGGDELKPADELSKLAAAGYRLEYWQARLNPGAAAVAANGIITDKRQEANPVAAKADATFAGGKWAVTLSRPLSAGAPFKDLVPGKTYTVGFAIHAGHTARRFHYVSFEHTLVLDQGDADLVAKKN
ncbi:MAG: ethylbenzene dehydrogenase-related protein [Actinomycetota bacterium]